PARAGHPLLLLGRHAQAELGMDLGRRPLSTDVAVLGCRRRPRVRLRDRPRARRRLGAPGEARLDVLDLVRAVSGLPRAVVAGRRLLLPAPDVRDPRDLPLEPPRRAAGSSRRSPGRALEGPRASVSVRARGPVLAAPARALRVPGRPDPHGTGPSLRAPHVR